MEKTKTSSAVKILKRRYIKDDKAREESVENEKINSRVASMIFQLRTEADLSQKDLADLIGTTQSVISRLEDADYDGHSLGMLERITKALGYKLRLASIPQHSEEPSEIHRAFQRFILAMRKEKGLSVEAFAKQIELEKEVVWALENDPYFKTPPIVLHKLASFFNIPQMKLNALAGAVKEIPEGLRREASRFAAKAESFVSLSEEEKKSLDEFMKALRSGT